MTAAPIIYAPRPGIRRLGIGPRALAGILALAGLGVLIVGTLLPPDASGTGTHIRLGLAPCQFLYRTGLPCPSCGLTTSVAYLAHGNLPASLWVQPLGTLFGIACALLFWIGGYIACTGKPVYRLMNTISAGYYLLPLMFFAIAAWGWKILLHWRGIDGWQ